MKRLTRAFAVIVALTWWAPTASADDRDDPPPPPTTAAPATGSDDHGYWVRHSGEAKPADPSARGGSSGRPSGDSSERAAPAAGSAGCWGANQVTGDLVQFTYCADAPAPILTTGVIRDAFARLDLPAGTLVIQPPDGLTLVNFDTNFYTTSTEPIARTVTLLGRRVTLEATPSTYRWTFGDGESLTTTDPGARYPDLRVTHNYLRTDTYRPSLATTYSGRYRVGGGPWRQIPGTVTINGTGQSLRAIEAQPKLVSY